MRNRRKQIQEGGDDIMTIKCPHCGTEYETDPKSIGMSVICETCRRSFIVRSTSTGGNKNMDTMNKSVLASGNKDSVHSHCGISNRQNIPLWICVGILLLNLIALVCICCTIHGNTVELKQIGTAIKKELSNMGEDISNVDGILQTMKKELTSVGKDISTAGDVLSNIKSRLESGETGVIIEGTRNSDNAIYRPVPR